MKALNTYYNGYLFRSRLEARWAVFFDSCGVSWEYESQGYELKNGLWYLPDFLLHDVWFNHAGYGKYGKHDLYVEVKGFMSKDDANKIRAFAEEKPILLVEDIPNAETMIGLCECMSEAETVYGITPYNFETVDGDWFGAYPGVDLDGTFTLFGDDSTYLDSCDEKFTVNAYRKARCARFEQGDIVVEKLKKGVI